MLPDLLYVSGVSYVAVKPPRFVGWRCLHPSEGGFPTPADMPNVRRAQDAPPVKFTAALQRLAWDVMRSQNSTITLTGFESIFGDTTAFTNRHGVNSDDPKLMDGIICAGMFLPDTVEIEGNYLIARPGVHAIDANGVLPSVQQVVENGWYFIANTGQGRGGAFNFPQGNLGPVAIIYALSEPVHYLMSGYEGREYTNFTRWSGSTKPDPLRYGG